MLSMLAVGRLRGWESAEQQLKTKVFDLSSIEQQMRKVVSEVRDRRVYLSRGTTDLLFCEMYRKRNWKTSCMLQLAQKMPQYLKPKH